MKPAICVSRALLIATVSFCVFASNGAANPRDSETSRADQLASAVYFEGVPFEDTRELSADDVARLIELLDDPTEIRKHSNILVTLGMSGSPAAFDAINDYASRGSSGELDRLEFRARRSIATGMGHLARVDGRALAWLIRAATDANDATQQSFRQIDSDRFARMMRREAITGLALSAHPAAARVLSEIVTTPGADARIVEHGNEALLLHRRMFREGPGSVLRDQFRSDP
jgi:hypothetical protein